MYKIKKFKKNKIILTIKGGTDCVLPPLTLYYPMFINTTQYLSELIRHIKIINKDHENYMVIYKLMSVYGHISLNIMMMAYNNLYMKNKDEFLEQLNKVDIVKYFLLKIDVHQH